MWELVQILLLPIYNILLKNYKTSNSTLLGGGGMLRKGRPTPCVKIWLMFPQQYGLNGQTLMSV